MSESGGIVVAIADDQYAQAIAKQLTAPPLLYDVEVMPQSLLADSVKEQRVTFALEHVSTGSSIELRLIYDASRDYVHTKFIEATQKRLSALATAVRSVNLSEFNIPEKTLQAALKPVDFKVENLDKQRSNTLIIALAITFWMVCFSFALEACKRVLFHSYSSDSQFDQMTHWMTENISPFQVVLGRTSASLAVFSLSSTVLFMYAMFWGWVYHHLMAYMAPSLSAIVSDKPELYAMTIGYLEFVYASTWYQFVGVWLVLQVLGAVAISLISYFSILANSSEAIRSKTVLIDLAFSYLPLLVMVLGVSGISGYLLAVPGFNHLGMILAIFSHDVEITRGLMMVGSSGLVALALLFRTARRLSVSQ